MHVRTYGINTFFIGNDSFIRPRRLKFLRDYTWSVYRGSKEAKDKRNSGKWRGIFIANKTFSMVTIVATTVYNSRTCNGIAWNRSILFHSIFLLFHRDPSSVSTFQWQLWSKLDKSFYFFLSLSLSFASFARRSYSNYSFLDEIIILTFSIKIINDRLIEKRNDRSSSKFVHYYLIKIPSKIKQSLLHCVLDFAISFFKLR